MGSQDTNSESRSSRRSRVSIQIPGKPKEYDEEEEQHTTIDDKKSKSSILSGTTAMQAMDDETLVKNVEDMQKATRYFNLENQIVMSFFEKNDPGVVEAMGNILKTAQTMYDRVSISSRRFTFSRTSRKGSSGLMITSPSVVLPAEKAEKQDTGRTVPKVNMNQKTDLVLKEMEEIQNNLVAETRRSQIVKTKLKCELEEMAIRENELQQSLDSFETVFILGTSGKFTQKNPTEKFIRFMEDWHRNARLVVDKIRLRTTSLKVQYQKICGILAHKKLIGENLQEVDFEQLHIENKHLQLKIDSRNSLLLELKRMNGNANLLLSNHKKLLAKKIADMKDLQDAITEKEDKTVKLDDECHKVSKELDTTKYEYDRLQDRIRTYRVPDIIDYVRRKAELGALKKNVRVWARRKQIKDMALAACVREIKQLQGLADSFSCFNPDAGTIHHASDASFHFRFERKKRKSWHLKAVQAKSSNKMSFLINKPSIAK